MDKPACFIVIDDDAINNMLCSIVINRVADGADIKTFTLPEQGLEFIKQKYADEEGAGNLTLLFLDINMPTWTGWEFLKHFETLSDKIKNQLKVYMLSSSLDLKDKERAQENKNVVDYIIKPLSAKIVSEIILAPN